MIAIDITSYGKWKIVYFSSLYIYKHLRDIENEGFLEVHVEGFHALTLNTLLQNIDF